MEAYPKPRPCSAHDWLARANEQTIRLLPTDGAHGPTNGQTDIPAMNMFAIIGSLAGGIGLFMLGMGLMTDGLKLAAGPALERILARWTSTRFRGLASGALVTALVQSSTAITVATIGFVNAGLLNLSQAIWVVFGSNIGSTMTGWLVALVGLKFNIQALALPLIGIGMLLRLTGQGVRRGSLGTALAGFGLLFLGIDMLREAFTALPADFALPAGEDWSSVLLQVLAGFVMTLVMQSSAASLTIALTAAEGGLLTIQGAAAVVIGANVGTTATAVIAAIGATPNARRVAAAHVLLNVIAAAVALALLPWMPRAIAASTEWIGLGSAPAPTIALYHTAFNLLGVALVWPLADRMIAFLKARFRAKDDEVRSEFLDRTVLAVPELAIAALEQELDAMGAASRELVHRILAEPRLPPEDQTRRVEAMGDAIHEFISQLSRAEMSEESAHRLPDILRVARHHASAARFALEAAHALEEPAAGPEGAALGYPAFREAAQGLLAGISPAPTQPGAEPAGESAVDHFAAAYERFKSGLLASGARGDLPLDAMECWLRAASGLRRSLDETNKASAGSTPPSETPTATSDT